MFLKLPILLVLFIGQGDFASLPSYIKRCKLSDPEFETCAAKTATDFLKHILEQGDSTLLLPSVREKIPILTYSDFKDYSITMTDANILGYSNFKIEFIRKVPNKNRIEGVITHPTLSDKGKFNVYIRNGDQIFDGKGPGIWHKNNVTTTFGFEWTLEKRNGVKYIRITKTDVDFVIENSVIDIKLEKGNRLNEFFNENAELIEKGIHESELYYSDLLFSRLIHTILDSVPYDEVFLK